MLYIYLGYERRPHISSMTERIPNPKRVGIKNGELSMPSIMALNISK